MTAQSLWSQSVCSVLDIFTYLVETDHWNKMAVYATASVCNMVLLGQMVFYDILNRLKLKEV